MKWRKRLRIAILLIVALAVQRIVFGHRRLWPLNGIVINDGDVAVRVWTSEQGTFALAAHTTSRRYIDDIDHVESPVTHRWFKIGVGTVLVDKSGAMTGTKCPVSMAGDDCGD